MGVPGFLAVYVLGGLTFIPLVVCIVFLHAYMTLPAPARDAGGPASSAGNDDKRGGPASQSFVDADADYDAVFASLPDELKTRAHVPDVAAGYFAVCREYVPGGINGKPLERTTPAGAVVATESPSVYQAMYRSLFDRNKPMSPTLDSQSAKSRKARNVFYVVLRLGILMLYDDAEQLEVRHVVSLAHYAVDVYAGGHAIPEGELWIKRNCIRLAQRAQPDGPDSAHEHRKPFYLFSENCSEKEDFYHAMLLSQDGRADGPGGIPRPLKFETHDMVRLVQQLHASEENMHTRWINALIGRLFLALYKTDQVEQFIWNKITKKIARVPKPALISKINLQKVDMGTLPPFITNPKLRELTVDGDLTVEADVSYKGNFRVEISAIARIELGSRFKAREVTLVLATTLKKLEGKLLLRMKPPPSNRLWMTFESAPKMELSLEPIVSSRQITYGVILRAIESRLREVVSETLVLPNWDDIPFKDTELNEFRGGIWTNDAKKEHATSTLGDIVAEEITQASKDNDESDSDDSDDGAKDTMTASFPHVELVESPSTGFSSATDIRPPIKPIAMRSRSFASAASPVINVDAANASASKGELRERHHDAATAIRTISQSQSASPAETPIGSPSRPPARSVHMTESRRSTSPTGSDVRRDEDKDIGDATSTRSARSARSAATLPTHLSESTDSSIASTPPHMKLKHGPAVSLPRSTTSASADKRQLFNQSLNSATAAAKKWFANRQQENAEGTTTPHTSKPGSSSSREQIHTPSLRARPSSDSLADSASVKEPPSTLQYSSASVPGEPFAPLGSPANPIGRGQLIPEAGLHPPGKLEKKNSASGWGVVPAAAAIASLTRRKPVGLDKEKDHHSHSPEEHAPSLPARPNPSSATASASASAPTPGPAPPPAPHTHFKPAHERKTSVGTAAMGRRRNHSSAQPPLPPMPSPGGRRRTGTNPLRAAAAAGGASPVLNEDGVFVVEAPVTDLSAQSSPSIGVFGDIEEMEIGATWAAGALAEEQSRGTGEGARLGE